MQEQSYRLIPLHGKDGSIRTFTKVDSDIYEFINQWKWCLTLKDMLEEEVTTKK